MLVKDLKFCVNYNKSEITTVDSLLLLWVSNVKRFLYSIRLRCFCLFKVRSRRISKDEEYFWLYTLVQKCLEQWYSTSCSCVIDEWHGAGLWAVLGLALPSFGPIPAGIGPALLGQTQHFLCSAWHTRFSMQGHSTQPKGSPVGMENWQQGNSSLMPLPLLPNFWTYGDPCGLCRVAVQVRSGPWAGSWELLI